MYLKTCNECNQDFYTETDELICINCWYKKTYDPREPVRSK